MKNENFKTTFKFFTIAEHEKEEEFLREQHKQGWKFQKIGGLGAYHFVKCEPEDVVYQLDYNLEGASHRSEYHQMFQDCGWEYIQEFMGYSYFRKPVAEMKNGEEEIFSDDASKADMIKRVIAGRLCWLWLIGLFNVATLINMITLTTADSSIIRKILIACFGATYLVILYFTIVLGIKAFKRRK